MTVRAVVFYDRSTQRLRDEMNEYLEQKGLGRGDMVHTLFKVCLDNFNKPVFSVLLIHNDADRPGKGVREK